MLTQKPKGTNDLFPPEVYLWEEVERKFREVCRRFGYQEIRTPIFEHTELFERGVGETTDIVEKEMYTFLDKAGRSITLRPEGTAAVIRAYVEAKKYAEPGPAKYFYIGPMFRYDKPQAGRLRQFHQLGVEILGSDEPMVDAEVILMAVEFYRRIGLTDVELRLNSVGCPICRKSLREKLIAYFGKRKDELCELCKGRLERNPLRILDCKNESCQNIAKDAPTPLSELCPDCREHFSAVKKYLDLAQVKYVIDPFLVRGLDYYTKTAFEFVVPDIGAQSSIGGGGRYNGLIREIGGPDQPGIGFALGEERTILALKGKSEEISVPVPDLFVCLLGEEAREYGFPLINELRRLKLWIEVDYQGKSLKAQLKAANRLKAKAALIIGEEELKSGKFILRDLDTGNQVELSREELIEKYVKERGKDNA
ncbi:histidine--tRNA ligase [Carboxydothermus pertinax]|uniref:Histidine--tRNA ligase n=1 Tax=Carboxydothermus pertinax TaxID=870242 RepID=A0A1L8CS15_9THEO|nr:histidine--tRNA ligase [Carboxydothermus pertinax]GAV21721.1 histidine--tRNA ligase [Carboxydothermus pertinax]